MTLGFRAGRIVAHCSAASSGAVAGGALSDILGRKKPLLVAALLFGVASAGNALADSFSTFVAWRVVGRIAISLASSLTPLYVAEIAPAHMRGKLVAMNQVAIMVGISRRSSSIGG